MECSRCKSDYERRFITKIGDGKMLCMGCFRLRRTLLNSISELTKLSHSRIGRENQITDAEKNQFVESTKRFATILNRFYHDVQSDSLWDPVFPELLWSKPMLAESNIRQFCEFSRKGGIVGTGK